MIKIELSARSHRETFHVCGNSDVFWVSSEFEELLSSRSKLLREVA